MKRALISLFILAFSMNLFSQVPDSILTERIDKLDNRVMTLKKSTNSLSYRISILKKEHKQDLEQLQQELKTLSDQLTQLEVDLQELTEALTANLASTEAEIQSLRDWASTGLLWLAILFAVLFLVCLILIFVHRSSNKKNYLKAEAKMLNIGESINLEMKELRDKHGEDLQTVDKRLSDLEKGEDKLKKK